ncbi:NAD-dependent epimerase/dehydratase family protein [Levilactobacillus acidifarinae]|uniref:Dehydrogenase n=1 Tax=Levilactobacillus acidifarinae DSM 19394 = JCM 15949 TaxID=1423715 RepID=A0A0R1LWR4_9LACO|nr:NAD-dependent epimerase/dehydratase family protein [Levilactobacillus acidifarinae]KRK96151.1 dehydrogenase [Levilactobacillus acidifarinae DSM 19394]GEO69512.1 dihydroflavonol-4-reductase [Levilactobacillus acidifarinae]
MKKVIITGGTGFVAGWVIVEFLQAGYQVATSVRSLKKAPALTAEIATAVTPTQLAHFSCFEADLTSDHNWVANLRGADGVIHVASPMGNGTQSVNELVTVAQNGTLTVLKAAKAADVSRVVMTSSQAVSTPLRDTTATLDESFWTDPKNPDLDPYRRSKVAAETAAWDYARANDLALTTILPGAIFGPILSPQAVSSNRIILQLLQGMPLIPHVPLEISDVRDLAHLHRLAFEQPVAVGNRYLAASQTLQMIDVERLFQAHFPERHLKVRALPNWGTKLAARFIPNMRSLVPMLDRQYHHTTAAAEHDLGWTQHRPEDTVLAAARALQKFGLAQ